MGRDVTAGGEGRQWCTGGRRGIGCTTNWVWLPQQDVAAGWDWLVRSASSCKLLLV